MAADPILTLDNVSVRYGPRPAVEGLTLAVHASEIVGLLGPNGSGKSSTLAVAAGVLEPAAGSVRVAGLSRRDQPFDYARLVGVVPQEIALYDELTAAQNLACFGRLYGLGGPDVRERITEGLRSVGLEAVAAERVGTLSGGMQRRLNLACALLHRPALLLLDEPTVGMDDALRRTTLALLRRLRDEGRAVLLTTHHLDEAERLCDRVALLDGGRLRAVGPAAVLRTYGVEADRGRVAA